MISRNRLLKVLENWIQNYESSVAKKEGKPLELFIISMIDNALNQAEEDWYRLIKIRREWAKKAKEVTNEKVETHKNLIFSFIKGLTEDDVVMAKLSPKQVKPKGNKRKDFNKGKPRKTYQSNSYRGGYNPRPTYTPPPSPFKPEPPKTQEQPKKRIVIVRKKPVPKTEDSTNNTNNNSE